MGERKYYDREILYKEIWDEPVSKVAKRYGVSDVALAKTCKRLNVPRPPVGYWVKKEFRKAPRKPRLPKFENPPKLVIHEPKSIKQEEKYEPQDYEAFNIANQLLQQEGTEEFSIFVADECSRLHPYVRNTRHALKENIERGSGDYGRILSYGVDVFSVNIGPDSIDRVLLILNALYDAFQKRGFPLIPHIGYRPRDNYLMVEIQGISVQFRIIEESRKIEISKDNHRYGHIDYRPTGVLSFELLYPPTGMIGPKKWKDSSRGRLEEKLNDVLIGLITASAWKKEYKAIHQKQHEEYLVEAEKRRIKEQEDRKEQQRIDDFIQKAESWKKHQLLTEYLNAVKDDIHSKNSPIDSETEQMKWVLWAESYLNKTNPFHSIAADIAE